MTRVVVLAVVPLSAHACSLVAPDVWEERREVLERNRDLWRSERIVAYRFTSTTSCECIPGFVGPVEITVEEDRIISVTPLREGEAVAEEQWAGFDTVERIFDRIASAVDRRAHRFDVTYHPDLGYPTRVSLDVDEKIADDELLFVISELTVLERE